MKQGKQLSDRKVAEIVALDAIGNGGRKIAKATNTSKSTVHKYQKLTPKLRDSKKEDVIDRSWQIIEMADEIVKEKIQDSSAKDAAIIGKIQTDRLLDLTNPTRNADKTLVVLPILGGKTKE